jgi:hypothetical protein
MDGACSTNGLEEVIGGKPEGERPLGRPRRRSADNTNMHLGDIGWGGVEWIGLA